MKKYFLFLLCVLMIASAAEAFAQRGQILIDRIVAVVEDDVIMKSELDERLTMIQKRLGQRGEALPPPDVLGKQVLEHLIVERIQLRMASRRGIRIDDLTLNEAMRSIATRNGTNLEAFREKLLDEDIDYVQFREQVRTELIIKALRERAVERKVQVTDQEVADLISGQVGKVDSELEYRLSHILITIPEAASADEIKEARDKAESVRDRLVAGEGFEQLAVSESDGQKALEGGDLGWRKASQLPTVFTRYVVAMQVGEISEVIRSPSGFHIIRLADRVGEEAQVVEQTRARHILLKTSALINDEKARTRLDRLKRRIENGESFAELAKANSDDTGSAIEGGDLGWTNPGSLVPEFERVMNKLKIAQVSAPFKSPFGWHIVEVLERRTHDSTQEALRSQARNIILRRKVEEETELWLRRLRDESYVEYRLEIDDQAEEG
jgi:peptidyl-prolyl cis-trans isomerase SurA